MLYDVFLLGCVREKSGDILHFSSNNTVVYLLILLLLPYPDCDPQAHSFPLKLNFFYFILFF